MTAITGTTTREFLEKIMRIPYKKCGRSYAGADCYGIVYLAFNDLLGIPLKPFDLIEPDDAPAVSDAIKVQSETWLPVEPDQTRTFDVVVLRSAYKSDGALRGADIHMGMAWDGRLLHTEERNGPMHIPFSHASVRNRIRRIYRHKALA